MGDAACSWMKTKLNTMAAEKRPMSRGMTNADSAIPLTNIPTRTAASALNSGWPVSATWRAARVRAQIPMASAIKMADDAQVDDDLEIRVVRMARIHKPRTSWAVIVRSTSQKAPQP